MNCLETRRLLHAYTDGELDLVRSLEVEQHLQICAACAAEKQALISLRSALRAAPLTYSAPESLRRNVLRSARVPDQEPRPQRTPWLWQLLAAGATAFAVLTLILRPAGNSARDFVTNELVASHVRSLMAGHLTDVLSSDQHTVKPWFNGKLDFSPDVKDFAAQGFPLVGGRLDYLNGRAVASLVYRRNQHLINVFVWPKDGTGEGQTTVEHRRGYNLIHRDVKGLHYTLVSDLNAGELGELADLIGK
jgi:anti-sigma factor RsiW